MIAILDYGSGNLRSAQRAFEASGATVVVTKDSTIALQAKGLVVPGVGAFAACMRGLQSVGGDEMVRERAKAGNATRGICVGMQILFQDGDEHAGLTLNQGVGIWKESITKIAAPVLPGVFQPRAGPEAVRHGPGSRARFRELPGAKPGPRQGALDPGHAARTGPGGEPPGTPAPKTSAGTLVLLYPQFPQATTFPPALRTRL